MGDVINDSFLRSLAGMSEPDFARLSPVLGGQPTMMLGYGPEVTGISMRSCSEWVKRVQR
jgi:hypothetical protein